MSESIAGKVVVITGASSGLGEAAVRRLAAHGAKLILGARRIDRLQALAAGLDPPETRQSRQTSPMPRRSRRLSMARSESMAAST